MYEGKKYLYVCFNSDVVVSENMIQELLQIALNQGAVSYYNTPGYTFEPKVNDLETLEKSLDNSKLPITHFRTGFIESIQK